MVRRGAHLALALIGVGVGASAGLAAWANAPAAKQAASQLDAFMARVLERRNENWRTLHDYILSERERFELTGPSQQRLFGQDREYIWFIRDGYLIRSPHRVNGVEPGAQERQDYENRWLRDEQAREKRAGERERADAEDSERSTPADGSTDAASLVREGLEPRFLSEAYFMRFKFDPGNYFFAGRETIDGREVMRIEYYPTRLFGGDARKSSSSGSRSASHEAERTADSRQKRGHDQKEDFEREVERKFNKVALVTLWIDPAQHQIVKYTFENTDLNFLPGRWLARVGDISASMTMGQQVKDVWLPRRIAVSASLTLANGTYDAAYGREFFDYRQGEVKARIRSYAPREH